MEPANPPRKNYAMKEREFERVNTAPGLVAKTPPVTPGAGPDQVDPNDIHSMLRHNRAVEQHHGQDELVVKVPRKSRRRRDFWLLLIGGNLLVVSIVSAIGMNPMSLIFGLAGLVLISLGLIWVMWFVMDDY